MKRKGSVGIAGYYGFGNAGDELVLLSLIRQLRKENPAVQIAVFSSNPDTTAHHFDVKAINRWRPWEWIRVLWATDLFILGGGGLLQESTGLWNHVYYLTLLALAKLLGCRTEVRSIGVDPIGRWWNRMGTRFVFNVLVDYASVRDTDSQRVLETTGVRTRLWRVPDPIFYLECPKTPLSVSVPRIAWAISSWTQRPGWEHDLKSLLERVANQLKVANDLLVFFPVQDEALAKKVSELTGRQTIVRGWTQPEDLLNWIQTYQLVIGMRYHALALAALAEKPFIGWGFQRKVRTLCSDFNQPMWTFERGWDEDAVFRQVCEAWRHRDVLPDRYRTRVSELIKSPPEASESARIFVSTV